MNNNKVVLIVYHIQHMPTNSFLMININIPRSIIYIKISKVHTNTLSNNSETRK